MPEAHRDAFMGEFYVLLVTGNDTTTLQVLPRLFSLGAVTLELARRA